MKKIVLVISIILACVSCSENYMYKDRCYKVNYTMADGRPVETYQWLSRHDVQCQEKLFESYKYTDVKYTRVLKYKTINDCIAADTCTIYGK